MNGDQCRVARAGLHWSARKLAESAGVGEGTVRRFEAGHAGRGSPGAIIRKVLEAAGVLFVDDEGAFPGVRIPTASRNGPARDR